MAESIRKRILKTYDQVERHLDALDACLYYMETIADGRQPALLEYHQILLDGHDAIRDLWKSLRAQL